MFLHENSGRQQHKNSGNSIRATSAGQLKHKDARTARMLTTAGTQATTAEKSATAGTPEKWKHREQQGCQHNHGYKKSNVLNRGPIAVLPILFLSNCFRTTN